MSVEVTAEAQAKQLPSQPVQPIGTRDTYHRLINDHFCQGESILELALDTLPGTHPSTVAICDDGKERSLFDLVAKTVHENQAEANEILEKDPFMQRFAQRLVKEITKPENPIIITDSGELTNMYAFIDTHNIRLQALNFFFFVMGSHHDQFVSTIDFVDEAHGMDARFTAEVLPDWAQENITLIKRLGPFLKLADASYERKKEALRQPPVEAQEKPEDCAEEQVRSKEELAKERTRQKQEEKEDKALLNVENVLLPALARYIIHEYIEASLPLPVDIHYMIPYLLKCIRLELTAQEAKPKKPTQRGRRKRK